MVEVAVSLAILSVCIICTFGIVNNLINSREERLIKGRVDECLYAICCEIKYNVSYKDIKNEVLNNKLILRYNENFLEDISGSTLLSMNRNSKENEKVEVELLEDMGTYMTIKVRIIYKGIEEEQSILKAEWMDYV